MSSPPLTVPDLAAGPSGAPFDVAGGIFAGLTGRPEPLLTEAAVATSTAQQVAWLAAGVRAGAAGDWTGSAASAAAADHAATVARVTRTGEVLARLALALQAAAEGVAAAARLADQAESVAHAHGLVVGSGGQLIDLTGASPITAAAEVTGLAASARRLADETDRQLATSLRAVLDDLAHLGPPREALTGLAVPFAPVATTPAPGDPPQTWGAWWAGLTRDQQEQQIASHTEAIGAANGLPAWARDRANRILLERAEPVLEDAVVRLAPPPLSVTDVLGGAGGSLTVGTFGGGDRRVAYERAVDQLAAVRATQRVLAGPDGCARQLLVLDLSGRQTRVAVAEGDVDRADHVAVVVHGFTTTVQRDLPGAVAVAADLADLSRREALGWGDRGEVAVVTWLGYDAPQTADTLSSGRSVLLRSSAEAGATALAGFLRGLPAGRHLTVVGHSYGSTVSGLAVARGGSGVDDLVVMGSPGLGVQDTTRLGLPAGRLHVLEADQDLVADAGWFGTDPDRLPGIDRLSTEAAALPDGRPGARSTGHSSYLAAGTTSQWNVAAVVAGGPPVRR